MAPNKFEEHIKKQFEEREIAPSANAWASLSDKLDAAEPKEKKRGYMWYGVAASVIGLLLTVAYLNILSSSAGQNVQVVDAPKKSNKVIVNEKKFEEVLIDQDVVEIAHEKEKSVKQIVPQKEEKTIALIEKKERGEDRITSKTIDTLSEALASNLANKDVEVDPIIAVENLMNTKVLEILEKVSASKSGKFDIASLEVDSLLRKAHEEILAQSRQEKKGWVNATALLVEVEDELDSTFRDRIFMVLEDKLIEASAAVATRNN